MKKVIEYEQNSTLMLVRKWCREIGITPLTAWRWRKRGWLTTTNIAGRQYITASDIANFERRAKANEFATANHLAKADGGPRAEEDAQ